MGSPQKERKKTDNPREGWEDGTPPPHGQSSALSRFGPPNFFITPVSLCVCQSAPVRALVVPVCCERGLHRRILYYATAVHHHPYAAWRHAAAAEAGPFAILQGWGRGGVGRRRPQVLARQPAHGGSLRLRRPRVPLSALSLARVCAAPPPSTCVRAAHSHGCSLAPLLPSRPLRSARTLLP